MSSLGFRAPKLLRRVQIEWRWQQAMDAGSCVQRRRCKAAATGGRRPTATGPTARHKLQLSILAAVLVCLLGEQHPSRLAEGWPRGFLVGAAVGDWLALGAAGSRLRA